MEPKLSPAAWLQFLEPHLDAQVRDCKPYSDYYDGKHRLAMATAKFRETFSRYFPPMANNWMQIVVDVPVSRLTVMGFRFGDEAIAAATSGKKWELNTDPEAWKIWQANNLDSIQRLVHLNAVKHGTSYTLVGPPRKEGGAPTITPEIATQCYVYMDPEDLTHRLAGIKRWCSDFDGMAYCNVYLPDAVYKFVSTQKPEAGRKVQWKSIGSVRNPAGVVTLIPMENKPDLEYGGRSDLEQAIPIQDAINKYCLDMQVSSEFHAYPQRWASGWERAVDNKGRDLSDRNTEMFLGANRFLRAESENTKFGQFTQGDVENYLKPIMMYLDHLAGQTQTPGYYLKGGTMRSMSSDTMHAEDQGLVDRVSAKILSLSDGWEETMRVAFLMADNKEKGEAESAEILWKDPESKSLAVVVQAAMIMRTQLQAPIEMCWELLGWTPQQIQAALELMDLPPGGGEPPQAMAMGTSLEGRPNDAIPGASGGRTPGRGQTKGQANGQAAQPRTPGH